MMNRLYENGIEDTPWKHPNSDELLKDNLEMFTMARDLAGLLGRVPASANDYRALIGKPELAFLCLSEVDLPLARLCDLHKPVAQFPPVRTTLSKGVARQ
jgi:hypothetical protein